MRAHLSRLLAAQPSSVRNLLRMSARSSVSLGALLLCVACGGGAQTASPKTPAQAQSTQNPGVPVAATPAGQQFAVSDAPTSADATGGAHRPGLSGSALTAYQAGMQAFQAGDLLGAKNQFVAATQADSKAYQAYYSLGVVRERLNETAGALQAYRQATATSRPSLPTPCCSRAPANPMTQMTS